MYRLTMKSLTLDQLQALIQSAWHRVRVHSGAGLLSIWQTIKSHIFTDCKTECGINKGACVVSALLLASTIMSCSHSHKPNTHTISLSLPPHHRYKVKTTLSNVNFRLTISRLAVASFVAPGPKVQLVTGAV